jgi:N-glycosylase/DNA lyase
MMRAAPPESQPQPHQPVPAPRIIAALSHGSEVAISFPEPNSFVFGQVRWGRADELFTPAYWKLQAWFLSLQPTAVELSLGRTFQEEVAACLLGGYGLPAEVALAAFHRLRSRNLLVMRPDLEVSILRALVEPLCVNGRPIRYRFAAQRSRYLACALRRLADERPPEGPGRELRKWLLRIRGIGWKTASWIARNWLKSEDVAVIDVHVRRACLLAGVFRKDETPLRDYPKLENRFLAFSESLSVKPSLLDAVIWRDMRAARRVRHDLPNRSSFLGYDPVPKSEARGVRKQKETPHVRRR